MSRVLRDSKGRFAGSRKGGGGWGPQAGPRSTAAQRRKVVRHTIKQANRAGFRGAGRAIVRGGVHGAVSGVKSGVILGAGVALSSRRGGLTAASALKAGAITVGATAVTATVHGAVTSRPLSAYRSSASASAALGLANRKTKVDAKLGVTRKQSLSSTYKGYGRAGSLIRSARKVSRVR